jgi:prephenate dehydrogenase
VGARVIEIDPQVHDRVVAALSHLPHAVAYTLAGSLGGRPDLRGFAGPSFRDTTRVAATAEALWVDVLEENRDALLPLLDAFSTRLAALREAVAAGDRPTLTRLLQEGRAAREEILS